MVRELYEPNTSYDQYWWALQAAYSNGYRIYDPDFASKQDIDIEEKIRRDPIIVQAMTQRYRDAAGADYTIQPWSEREDDILVASIIADLLKEVGNFPTARYNLAQGVMDARAFGQIRGRRMTVRAGPEGTKPMRWWCPKSIRDVDQRRIIWRPKQNGKRGEVEMWAWNVDTNTQEPVKDRRTLIEVVFEDTEARLGYGRGLKEAIYHYHWAKAVVLREGLQGLERWAQGLPIARIDTDRHGTRDQTTQQITSAYLNVLRDLRAKYGALAIDKNDEVDVVFPSEGGGRMVIDFLEYLDNSITRVITGALLPSGGGAEQGSLARAEVESETADSMVEFDRNVIDAAITRDLVGLIWNVNRENFDALGLGEAHMPTFKTTSGKVAVNPERNAAVISTLLAAGVPIKRDELYEKTDLTPPGEGDDVIEGAQQGAALGLPFQR